MTADGVPRAESLPIEGMALLDATGTVVSADEPALRLLGTEDVLGWPLVDRVAARYRAPLASLLGAIGVGARAAGSVTVHLECCGHAVQLECRALRGNGTTIHVALTAQPAPGAPAGPALVPKRDRKQRRGDELVEAVPMGLAVVDPASADLLWCNQRFRSLLGLGLGPKPDTNLSEIMPFFSAERFQRALDRAMAGEELRFERWLRHVDGSELFARVHACCVSTPDGERMLIAADNIDDEVEQRNALAGLMESTATMRGSAAFQNLAERLAAILDTKAFAVVEHDSAAKIGITRAWVVDGQVLPDWQYEFDGTPCRAVVGGLSLVVFSDVQRCYPRDADLVGINAVSYAGVPLRSHDRIIGHLMAIDDKPVVDSERLLSILTMYAPLAAAELLHERHAQEIEEMSRQVQRTQRLESLGILAGGIAHDFNNLLMSVLGHADLADRHLDRGQSVRRDLEQMRRSVHRAADLCNQLLAYAGKGRYRVQDVSVDTLIAEMGDLLEVSIDKNVSLRLGLTDEPLVVRGDPSQLTQVLMNLITNASEAMDGKPGEVWIRSRFERIDAEVARESLADDLAPGDYACVEVSDNGRGMPEAVRERIFEPFFSTNEHGRGLGLAAVLGIVRGHEGAIDVSSSPGGGTTVCVYLPASRSRAGERPTETPPHGARVPPGLRVLVVDDEPTVSQIVVSFLEILQATAEVAADGLDALQHLRDAERPFDLVILDLTMPRLNGIETLARIRSRDSRVPVVLMSGYSDAEVADQLRLHRHVQFLQKPFDMTGFVQVVAEALGAGAGPAPAARPTAGATPPA